VEFVDAREPHLKRVAYAICGDWQLAEDLLQTVFIKLYVAWPRVRREGTEEAYVRTIMVRTNIDDMRRGRGRELPGLQGFDRPAPPGTPHEDRRALFDAPLGLPEMQRKVVVLPHWLGLPVDETAPETRHWRGHGQWPLVAGN
jgi:RNA polymerase sigma factor (sigma-70 family)